MMGYSIARGRVRNRAICSSSPLVIGDIRLSGFYDLVKRTLKESFSVSKSAVIITKSFDAVFLSKLCLLYTYFWQTQVIITEFVWYYRLPVTTK